MILGVTLTTSGPRFFWVWSGAAPLRREKGVAPPYRRLQTAVVNPDVTAPPFYIQKDPPKNTSN